MECQTCSLWGNSKDLLLNRGLLLEALAADGPRSEVFYWYGIRKTLRLLFLCEYMNKLLDNRKFLLEMKREENGKERFEHLMTHFKPYNNFLVH